MIHPKTEIKCLKCGSPDYVKNGRVFGWQRYKCKACGYQFAKQGDHGKPLNIWLACHGLYVFGMSMRRIARIIGVSAQTVSRWIKKWHQVYMYEIGAHETLYAATPETLPDCLHLSAGDSLMVSSSSLPSGAEIHVIIKLPSAAPALPEAHVSPRQARKNAFSGKR